ncbi:MAG: acyl-CoA dehydrogenase family protein [Candidatus Eremiobacteraeota bacterium]|nr:acyl-CoA dehydrogenase family protein [Candidatus Eremiobacteraeota bacterium]
MSDLFSPEQRAFRDEVRAFIAARLDAETRRRVREGEALEKEDFQRWQRTLNERGWLATNWPVEHGGTGWDAVRQHIFEEECAYGWAPRRIPFGLFMVAPVLIAFGTDAQRARFLPRILRSEDWWCQGYSEPGAGSDLASLQMRAERRGDTYVLSGTKIWITYAQWADWIFVLARTNPQAKKHEGISFILADMRSPGITVRPIVTLDGSSEINEVHFENVEVPLENRVGDEGAGWTIAKFLLEHERTGTAGVARCRQQLAQLRDLVTGERPGDQRLAERIASVEIELDALAHTELRILTAEAAGNRPGPGSSLLKIKGTEIQQALSELALDAVGPYAGGPEAARYFNFRKTSIYAGSNEIQKNIIAKRVLGL